MIVRLICNWRILQELFKSVFPHLSSSDEWCDSSSSESSDFFNFSAILFDTFRSFAFIFRFPFDDVVDEASDFFEPLASDEVAETNRGLLDPLELLRVRTEAAFSGDLDRDEARDFSDPDRDGDRDRSEPELFLSLFPAISVSELSPEEDEEELADDDRDDMLTNPDLNYEKRFETKFENKFDKVFKLEHCSISTVYELKSLESLF